MKKMIRLAIQLPKWYGVGIVFVYGLLLAEFVSSVNHLIPIDETWSNIFEIMARISYWVTILSGVVVWLIMALLFHLTALLFNGQASFGHIARASSYPFIIPAVMILAGVFLLDGIDIPQTEEVINILPNHPRFKLAMGLINYSFIPYYLAVAVFIRYIYQIKYPFAILSVAIPVVSIWAITELFKWI
jgi:hypothetical protein